LIDVSTGPGSFGRRFSFKNIVWVSFWGREGLMGIVVWSFLSTICRWVSFKIFSWFLFGVDGCKFVVISFRNTISPWFLFGQEFIDLKDVIDVFMEGSCRNVLLFFHAWCKVYA